MTSLADLDLPFLPMETEAFANDPFRFVDEARRRHPWLARCTFGYVVHGHQAIQELLLKDDELRPSFGDMVELLGIGDSEFGRFQYSHIQNQADAAHQRLRGMVAPLFTPAAANRNRELMRRTMQQLLDEWAPRRGFDFEEFVSHFPITVMCNMIGADPAMVPRLRGSLEALGLAMSLDRERVPDILRGHQVMDEFVQELVAERRARPHSGGAPDLLDTLLALQGGEEGLSERELFDLLIFLFIAGYDTSKNVLTLLMNLLIDHPDSYRRCAEDAAWCRKVVQEGLRLHSPGTIPRRIGSDFDYGGVHFPAGELLFLTVSISGRDPAAFPAPHAFNPEREQGQRHAAFGRGAHMCLGQHIAKAQIEEGLHLIAQRLKNPRLTGDVGHRPFFGVWGLQGLPIAFEEGATTAP